MYVFAKQPKGLTKEEILAKMPKVGDVRMERPTIDIGASHYHLTEKRRCVVVEVQPEHLWYTVEFENGIRESYKLPKVKAAGNEGRSYRTKDELKKLLHSYRDLKAEYDHISMELEKVEAVMTAPKGINMDGMPKSGGPGDPILGIVAQHLALLDRYKFQLVKLAAAQALIEDLIEDLKPAERRLMRCRYIDGLTWEEVCVAIGYSWRQTHNIHSRILDEMLANVNAPKCAPVSYPDPCDGCAAGNDCTTCQGYE